MIIIINPLSRPTSPPAPASSSSFLYATQIIFIVRRFVPPDVIIHSSCSGT